MFNLNDLTDAASQYTKTAADLVGQGTNIYNQVTGKAQPAQSAQQVAAAAPASPAASDSKMIWIIGAVVVAALAWFFFKKK